MENDVAPTRTCTFRRRVSDSLIMLIALRVAFKRVTCGCFWISLEKKIAPASCSYVTRFRKKICKGGDGRRREASVEVLHQYHVMSLRFLTPRGAPWAMTSHPSPYALSHFTFIRTSNDFPPMKVRQEHNRSLVVEVESSFRNGNWTYFQKMLQIYSFRWGLTEVVWQHILHIFLYTQLHTESTQTLLCIPVVIQYVHTGWPNGSVHCNVLQSLYMD